MADSELDDAIKLTQDTLGKYVKKPHLSDKLLRKPPFRFLFDVFSVVIKDTGCFAGLYTADELKFDNINNRDDKMRFLQKMIDVIKLTTQGELTVRTSKIVAGQEPAKTNVLLQLMGAVIEQALDWQSAVAQVVGGEAPSPAAKSVDKAAAVKQASKAGKDGKTREDVKTKTKEPKAKESKTKTKSVTPSSMKEERPKVAKEKHISPTMAKEKKTAVNKDKETRSSSRMNKEAEGTKDKVVKKVTTDASRAGKASKSKVVENGKSPSPVKPEVPKEQRHSVKAESSAETAGATQNASKALATSVNDTQEHEELPMRTRRGSNSNGGKPPAEPMLQAANENGNNEITPVIDSSSRKSSAQRRGSVSSSNKSRVSSGQQQQREDAAEAKDTTQAIHAIKEAESQRPPATAMSDAPLKTANGTNMQASPQRQTGREQTDMKRETTFTRENSKDSNNSFNQRPRTSLRPPSARPPSARPGAPRRRDRNVEIVLQPNDQVKISGINVKLETFGDFDDDGENLVIIEDANTHGITNGDGDESARESAERLQLEAAQMDGRLVQQILETQKELVQQGSNENGSKDEQLSASARQGSARQMNSLRDVIQNLTKSVNPFGKLMDFIPEDIDAMHLELTMWRDAYTQASNELKRERNLTESATEPMKQQLIQIDGTIKEYLEMIDASRSKILQNNDKILKMLMEQ